MKDKPMLSIIVPMYNAEQYIEKQLLSILSTTSKDYEILVVNDGSTDGSKSVVETIQNEKIRLINKSNEGVYKTWQRGVTESNGQYILILDADDYLTGDYVSKCLEIIDKHHPDLTFFSWITEFESSSETIYGDIGLAEGYYSSQKLDNIRNIISGGGISHYKPCTLINKELLLRVLNVIYKGYIHDFEDWSVLIPLSTHCQSVYVCKDAYYHYVHHKESVSRSNTTYRRSFTSFQTLTSYFKKNQDILEINDIMMASIILYGYRSIFNRALSIFEKDLIRDVLNVEEFQNVILNMDYPVYLKVLMKLKMDSTIVLMKRLRQKIKGRNK